ncbi:MAG: bifunctional [glutamine synthetase] adenylyltransferase/[glutamine synthetase]-adenylyl-L-tyrosine phosphorylase [Actinobacteria bacterium]|nr:bifunctional [glutamine synthetase] adenylyltransferase/[glutamine synthetase]-adenylyl-L-tyrosine phosphorylase [Actinomycetota bacterium]
MGAREVPSLTVTSERQSAPAMRLARSGFRDPERAERLLDSEVFAQVHAEMGDHLASALGSCADPDLGLMQLTRLIESGSDPDRRRWVREWAADPDALARLLDIMGLSVALGDFLIRHSEVRTVVIDSEGLTRTPTPEGMRTALLHSVGGDPHDEAPTATLAEDAAMDALRIRYRELLLGVAVRDVTGMASVDIVAEWLSDLADSALEAALAIARSANPHHAASTRLAIIGMGKCGARELNYISDVDVIFVAAAPEGVEESDAVTSATVLAKAVMRICSTATAEGGLWEVDAGLRPEGKQGALVRTLESHLAYYGRWAKTWEFQALLKARFSAGDRALGDAYVDAVSPLIWSAADRDGFVVEVQAMRRRVEENVPAALAEREIKLGPGGLRDIEFSVQLLQLVHGRSDVMLRRPATLSSLEALATWGYVARSDSSSLADAYRFLRTLEHRLQLRHLRRTHVLPEDEDELRVIARSLGFRSDPIAELMAEWRRHAREARRLHEKLFYRPLLQAVARLDAGEARLSLQAAEERMAALGYANPSGALAHLTALTTGVSRRATIQRTLLPVLLGWFADGPDPDAGLLGFRQVSDDLGATPWYLRLLRDESIVAERMAHILSSSRYATDLLLRAPASVQMLAADEELTPRSLESLTIEVDAIATRHDTPEAIVSAIRAMRRKELFRLAVGEILGTTGSADVGRGLTDVATASIDGALRAAWQSVAGDGVHHARIAVIAMGRFGGSELGFASDADVMFVYEVLPDADETEAGKQAFAVANELRALLMTASTDPALEIDADLRPEGKSGPLVRSLDSYQTYYARWSSPWEAQALLRARAVAGDPDLGARFIAMIDPLRYPIEGLAPDALREMRRVKARMESERLPRGADPRLHMKLGPGGLSDVEWVAQLLQLQHAHHIPDLQDTSTLSVLDAAVTHSLLSVQDAATLRSSWLLATSIRNAVMLARGRPSDMVPTDPREAMAVGFILGRGARAGTEMREEYLRVSRRARQVMERVFYGE